MNLDFAVFYAAIAGYSIFAVVSLLASIQNNAGQLYVTPLGWLKVADFAEQACPKCGTSSGAQKATCPQCGGPLSPRFQTALFKLGLRDGVGQWPYGCLAANRNNLFSAAFPQCPDLGPFVEAKTCIALLRGIVTIDLPRIANEVMTLGQNPDFAKVIAREGLVVFVASILQDAQQSLARLEECLPANPADAVMTDYKIFHTDYIRKRIAYKAKVRARKVFEREFAEARQAAEPVADALARCTAIGDALTHQDILKAAQAQFKAQVAKLAPSQVTPAIHHVQAEWDAVAPVLAAMLATVQQAAAGSNTPAVAQQAAPSGSPTAKVAVAFKKNRHTRRGKVFQAETGLASEAEGFISRLSQYVKGNKRTVLASVIITMIATSAAWWGLSYLNTPQGQGIPVPAATPGSIRLSVAQDFFVELRNQSELQPTFYEKNYSLPAISFALLATMYSDETWQNLLHSNVTDMTAYAEQQYGSNATFDQNIFWVTMTGGESFQFLTPLSSSQLSLPSIDGRFCQKDVPAGWVVVVFGLELSVDMGNYTVDAININHYFTGLTFFISPESGTISFVSALRTIGSQYICTGGLLSFTLVSAKFDIGTAYFDQYGIAMNSWQSPPRLTSVDVSVNSTLDTFTMVNLG